MCRVHSDLIICSISVFQAKVIVLQLQVHVWKDELHPTQSSLIVQKDSGPGQVFGCKTLMPCNTLIMIADRLPLDERLRRSATGCTWRRSSKCNRKTSGLEGGMEKQSHMCAKSSRLAVH